MHQEAPHLGGLVQHQDVVVERQVEVGQAAVVLGGGLKGDLAWVSS
jgi:hypothetical protein